MVSNTEFEVTATSLTEFDPVFATKAINPLGDTATADGSPPVVMVAVTDSDAVEMTVTEFALESLAT
jgi:hypothetical protein